MKILVLDTEPTGLPERVNNKYPTIENVDKWPYVIQLSYILYDTETRTMIDCQDNIIKLPSHVKISSESTNIHGINRSLSNRKGIPIVEAINYFVRAVGEADCIVAHNLSFDKRMIQVELHRLNEIDYLIGKKEFCTMKSNIEYCAIKAVGRNGDIYFKYPKLSELYHKMFGIIPKGTHNSMVDVLICLRCYCKKIEGSDPVKDANNNLRNIYKLYDI